jgi:hypothetical protein
MIDDKLIRNSYKNMSDEELIRIEIEDNDKISQNASVILQNEITTRGIELDKIKDILGKTDFDFFTLYTSNQAFYGLNGSSYLLIELDKRLKRYSRQFKDYDNSYLVSKIKSHKTEVEKMPQEDYLALLSYLKRSNISTLDEHKIDKILKSSKEELLLSTNTNLTEENDIFFNLHKAGNDIRKIGVNLSRYIIGQIFFVIGYILSFIVSGKPPSLILLCINLVVVIILIAMIISGFYEAGNALLNIKRKDNDSEML